MPATTDQVVRAVCNYQSEIRLLQHNHEWEPSKYAKALANLEKAFAILELNVYSGVECN